jgi:hypothetical protein
MSLPGDEHPNPQWQKRPPPQWQPDPGPVWHGEQQHPQFQRTESTPGLAIASLLLSISSFVVLPLIGSIAGVVCGHMARSQMRREGRTGEGNGVALAGVIIGWVGIAFYTALLLLIIGLIVLGASA